MEGRSVVGGVWRGGEWRGGSSGGWGGGWRSRRLRTAWAHPLWEGSSLLSIGEGCTFKVKPFGAAGTHDTPVFPIDSKGTDRTDVRSRILLSSGNEE